MSTFFRCVITAGFFFALSAGCRQEEGTQKEPPAAKESSAADKVNRVFVPPEVQDQWKAVKIAVLDKRFNTEEKYTVEIGSEFHLKEEGLILKVENFLPAFIMEGRVITSASNEPRNPAARVSISENGREIFSGWLFSHFPNIRSFNHPRYSFSLVDFIPAGKKG